MNYEIHEHCNRQEAHSSRSTSSLLPSTNDYRSFRDDRETRAKQSSQNLMNFGLLPELSLEFADSESKKSHCLRGAISNVPEVSQGVHNFDDARALIVGVGSSLQSFGSKAMDYLATPYAVNNSIKQAGPLLDTAVNYYANTSSDQVYRDAQCAIVAMSDSANEALSYPLKPYERGRVEGSLIPSFVLDGTQRALTIEKQICRETVAESELSQLGVSRITRKAGKGGDWPVLNERFSLDVVKQSRPDGCVSAIGEMLSDGKLTQDELYPRVKDNPENLPKTLGPEWKCITAAYREIALDQILRLGKPWGAELKNEFVHKCTMAHMVVVVGIDEAGNVMIRDPWDSKRYEMSKIDFIEYWTGRSIIR